MQISSRVLHHHFNWDVFLKCSIEIPRLEYVHFLLISGSLLEGYQTVGHMINVKVGNKLKYFPSAGPVILKAEAAWVAAVWKPVWLSVTYKAYLWAFTWDRGLSLVTCSPGCFPVFHLRCIEMYNYRKWGAFTAFSTSNASLSTNNLTIFVSILNFTTFSATFTAFSNLNSHCSCIRWSAAARRKLQSYLKPWENLLSPHFWLILQRIQLLLALYFCLKHNSITTLQTFSALEKCIRWGLIHESNGRKRRKFCSQVLLPTCKFSRPIVWLEKY